MESPNRSRTQYGRQPTPKTFQKLSRNWGEEKLISYWWRENIRKFHFSPSSELRRPFSDNASILHSESSLYLNFQTQSYCGRHAQEDGEYFKRRSTKKELLLLFFRIDLSEKVSTDAFFICSSASSSFSSFFPESSQKSNGARMPLRAKR